MLRRTDRYDHIASGVDMEVEFTIAGERARLIQADELGAVALHWHGQRDVLGTPFSIVGYVTGGGVRRWERSLSGTVIEIEVHTRRRGIVPRVCAVYVRVDGCMTAATVGALHQTRGRRSLVMDDGA